MPSPMRQWSCRWVLLRIRFVRGLPRRSETASSCGMRSGSVQAAVPIALCCAFIPCPTGKFPWGM
jgi:hypothetical protein